MRIIQNSQIHCVGKREDFITTNIMYNNQCILNGKWYYNLPYLYVKERNVDFWVTMLLSVPFR